MFEYLRKQSHKDTQKVIARDQLHSRN